MRTSRKRVNLTDAFVEKQRFTASGQWIHRDLKLQGFGLIVGKTAKSYFVEKRVKGSNVRSTIGQHGQIRCSDARKEAQRLLGDMAFGINPVEQKRAERARSVTFAHAFEDFLKQRQLSPKTVREYTRLTRTVFADWQKKPLAEISRDMVVRKHGRLRDGHGPALADLSMRMFRSLFNFAKGRYGDTDDGNGLSSNPVQCLSDTRSWCKIRDRKSYVRDEDFPSWFAAVTDLPNQGEHGRLAADYLCLVVFTGLRREEAAALRRQDIDLDGRTLHLGKTKNDEPLILPLSDFLVRLLEPRVRAAELGFIFPGSGKTGHLVEPKRQVKKVIDVSGVRFTVHDLRRTFINTAEALDLPYYAVKRLVNHRLPSNDVTAKYLTRDIERLREPMQQITDAILKKAGGSALALLRG